MLEELLEFLNNKKILILGFGLEGRASYNFLRRYFKDLKLYIADQKEFEMDIENKNNQNYESNIRLKNDIEKNLVKLNIGEKYLDNLEDYDLILKTPGLSFNDIDISKIEDKIYTSVDLFLKYFPITTIGITGSKGKSTTSSLIYTMLQDAGKDVYLLANIGTPIFDEIENIKLDSIVVLEISSYQLEFMKYTTKIAILTNIYPAHIAHHKTYENYILTKYKIFENEKNMKSIFPDFKQIQMYAPETDAMKSMNYKYNEEAICVDINQEEYKEIISKLNLKLKGKHNIQNVMFALMVADILNIDIYTAIKSVNNFVGLPHRLEYIEKINGVEYYNDSIATIPTAVIKGLETYKNTKTLIFGGENNGIEHNSLFKFLDEIYDNSEYSLENIILLPDTGHIFEDKIRKEYNKYKVIYVEEAAELAVKITKEGVCLLSPGSPSYGYYTNFQERGDRFKNIIHELKKEEENHEKNK